MVTAIGSDSVQEPCCKLALSFLLTVTADCAGAAPIRAGKLLTSWLGPHPYCHTGVPCLSHAVRSHGLGWNNFGWKVPLSHPSVPPRASPPWESMVEGWPRVLGWAPSDHRSQGVAC